MSNATMWQGVLIVSYIDTESKPGSTLLVSSHKVGRAHADPKTAWKDAEEFLERHQKNQESRKMLVHICICPDGYHRDQAEGNATSRTLN
jgi:hypothetical protein